MPLTMVKSLYCMFFYALQVVALIQAISEHDIKLNKANVWTDDDPKA